LLSILRSERQTSGIVKLVKLNDVNWQSNAQKGTMHFLNAVTRTVPPMSPHQAQLSGEEGAIVRGGGRNRNHE